MSATAAWLLLAPALASALTVDPDSRRPAPQLRKASSSLVDHWKSACGGRGDATDESFLSQCAACRLSGVDAPRIYILESKDGLGSRLHDVIAGMAIASKMGMVLGGAISREQGNGCHASHGIDIMKAAGVLFGLEDPHLMFTNHPPKFDQVWPGLHALESGTSKFVPKPRDNIFIANHCPACEMSTIPSISRRGTTWNPQGRYYSERLLAELRNASRIWGEPLAFKTGSTTVAIHVRRGDVDPADKLRGTSDLWYFSLIAQLRELAPDADIHVFSALEVGRQGSEFDGYRSRGVTVHLDGDPLEAWAHFAAADVFVMAKSSFSHVPAFLNGNCVVYQPYWHLKLKEWVVAKANLTAPLSVAAKQALQGCIANKSGARQNNRKV